MSLPHIPDSTRPYIDWSAVAVALGAWAKHLPDVAALFSIIWIGLQIYTWAEKRCYRGGKDRRKQP